MSLSSLIVQREIATIRAVEEALARQVLYGGDLVTNLLEVTVVDEARLNAAVAEEAGVTAGPAGVLAPPEGDRARKTLPVDLAARRAMYPLSMSEGGDKLVVAVAEVLTPEEEEQLMFALGVPIVQRLVPLVRIRQALAREFDVPLERRFERLVMRLSGEHHLTSSSRPPLLHEAPPGIFPPGPDLLAKPGSIGSPPVPRKVTSAGFPAVRPDAPILASDAIVPQRIVTFDAPANPLPTPTDVESLPPVMTKSEPPTDRDLRPRSKSGRPIDPAQRQTLLKNLGASARPLRRRLRPLTFVDARKELEDVTDRDGILDLFFDFGRQFFDYSALFVVHGDLAEGRDAYGPGAARDQVVGIGVPLDLPGLLATTRASKAPVVDVPAREGLDATLLADLRRGARGAVAVVPVVVRTRAVAMLFGDADSGVTHEAVTDVAAFALLAGQAFEKLILKKKLGGFSGGSPTSSEGRVSSRAGVPSKNPEPRVSQAPATVKEASVPPIPRVDADVPGEPMPLPTAIGRIKRPSDRSERAEALGRALFTNATVSVSPPSNESPMAASVSPDDIPQPPPPDSVPVEFAVPRRRPTPSFGQDEANAPAFAVSTLPRRASGRPPIPREDPVDATLRPPERVFAAEDSGPTLVQTDEEPAQMFEEMEMDSFLEDTGFPQSEAAVSVPPHLPPSSRTDGETLPSVIVEVGAEVTELVARFLADPRDEAVQADLVRLGEQAMPAIMAHFPGKLAHDPQLDEDEPPTVSACSPVLRLIVAQRRIALPFVLPHLNVTDETERFWATFLVSELPYVEALPGMLPRLHDPVDRIRRAARIAMKAIDRAHPEAVARELGKIVKDDGAERQRRALMIDVLEELREPHAVPALIHALSADSEELAQIARQALVAVTGQDFGSDRQRWADWWGKNASRHRIEWLIDSLVHEQPSIRNAAGEELKFLTKEYFGYYDDLPRRERDKAQARYREWWEKTGRAKFMGS
ncbi:MAG TPA: hypothetical protein VF407_23330 [Polyangiaceae bacterium]